MRGDRTEIRKDGTDTFIVREELPNTLAWMYVLPTKAMGGRQVTFLGANKPGADAISPNFAGQLLKSMPQITRMVIGTHAESGLDYVTITARKHDDWNVLQKPLENYLVDMAAYIKAKGAESVIDFKKIGNTRTYNEWLHYFDAKNLPNAEVEQLAAIALVNSNLAHDGGEIHHAGYEENTQTLNLWLDGACKGCPGSKATVEAGLMSIFRAMATDMEKPVRALNIVMEKPAKLIIA